MYLFRLFYVEFKLGMNFACKGMCRQFRHFLMGHAGAIIERGKGTFESKVEALTAAGVRVANLPWEVGPLVKQALAQGSEQING